MRRDVNKEDFQILIDLGYSTEEIYKLLNNSKAYKFKSFPEQYLVEVLSSNFDKVESNMKMGNGMELDIAIYDINTGIEYSGNYYHQNKERDKRKRDYIESKGVRLIEIREFGVSKVAEEKVEVIDKDTIHVYRADRSKRLQPLVKVLSALLGKELIIPENIYYKVKQRVYESHGKQCLLYQRPDLAKEYSPNNPIPSNRIFISDTDSVEWICKTCGNKWNTTVSHRMYGDTGCPYCAGNLAIPGKTDILTVLPDYANEIISETKEKLSKTLPYSILEVTWRCSKCKHEWKSEINKRTRLKERCPVCGYNPFKYNDTLHNIEYIYTNAKPIKRAIIFGEEYLNIKYAHLFEKALEYIFDEYTDRLYEIIDNDNYVTNVNKTHLISTDRSEFRIPKELGNLGIFYESHCSVNQTVGTLIKIMRHFEIDLDAIMIELDIDKMNNHKIKFVTRAKNGRDWNVFYRIKINKDDKKTTVVFIGSRPTYNEAVLLKLSSEIYYFGKIRDNQDTYEGVIPKFEDLPEFEKLKEAGRIRKQN